MLDMNFVGQDDNYNIECEPPSVKKSPTFSIKSPIKVISSNIGMYDGTKCNWIKVENSLEQIAITKDIPIFLNIQVGDEVTFVAMHDTECDVYNVLQIKIHNGEIDD